MNENIEINKVCRLCLTKEAVNVCIFEGKGDEEQLELKISTCLPILISRNDCFPKKICDDCLWKVNIMFVFWNTSKHSEIQLLEWFKHCGVGNQNTNGLNSDVKIEVKVEEVTEFLPDESFEEMVPSNFVPDCKEFEQEINEFSFKAEPSSVSAALDDRMDSPSSSLAEQNIFSDQKNILKTYSGRKLMVNPATQAKSAKSSQNNYDENNTADSYSSSEECDISIEDKTYVPDSGSDSENHENISNSVTAIDNNLIGTSSNGTIFLSGLLKKGAKRNKNDKQWKRNVLKKLRSSGQAYETHSVDKKIRDQRKVKPACSDKCRLKCSTKFSEEERKKLFTDYWSLGNVEHQRKFILNSMNTVHPKYRYVRVGGTRNKRQNNHAFYLSRNDESVRVCKLFYKNTLDINDRPIRTVLSKLNKIAGVLLEPDMRGKHGKQRKLNQTTSKA